MTLNRHFLTEAVQWRAWSALCLGPASALVAVCAGIQATDVFPASFQHPGLNYAFYNSLKLLLLPLLLLICHNLGSVARIARASENTVEEAALSAAVGLALLNVVVFATGRFGWCPPWVCISLITFLLAATGGATERVFLLAARLARMSRTHVLAWAPILVLLVAICVFKGIVPDANNDNDILGGYVPYYAAAKQDGGGLWDTSFFIHFFTSKGGGLQVLITQLADAHSISLAGGVALVLCLGLFVAGALRLTRDTRLLVTGSLGTLLLLSRAGNMAKPHLLATVMMGALALVLVRLAEQGWTRGDALLCCLFLLMGLAASTPVAVGLLAPVLCLTGVWAYFACRRVDLAMTILGLSAVSVAMLALVLLLNVLAVGLPEYSINFFDAFARPATMANHWSPVALFLQRTFNATDYTSTLISPYELFAYVASFAFDHSFPKRATTGVILLLMTLWLFASTMRSHCEGEEMKGLVVVCFMFAAVMLFLKIVIQHGAQDRFLLIRHLIGSWLLIFCYEGLRRRLAGRGTTRMAVLSLFLTIWATSLVQPLYATVTSIGKERLEFLVRGSYAKIYDAYFPMGDGLTAMRLIPGGERALCLNFSPGLYSVPGGVFQRPLQAVFVRDLHKVLYGPPDMGARALAAHKVHYAFFTLREIALLNVLAPTFSLPRLRDNWRLVWRSGHAPESFLFSSRPGEGEPIPDDVLAAMSGYIVAKGIHMEKVYAPGFKYARTLNLVPAEWEDALDVYMSSRVD